MANTIQVNSSKEVNPGSLSCKLIQNKEKLEDIGVFFTNHRSNGKRITTLKFENSEGSDGNSVSVDSKKYRLYFAHITPRLTFESKYSAYMQEKEKYLFGAV